MFVFPLHLEQDFPIDHISGICIYVYMYICICIYVYMYMYIYIYTFQLSAASTIKLEHVGICFGPRTSTESPKILSSKSVLISQVLRVVAHLRSRSRNHLFQRIQLLSIANKAVFRPVVWVGKVSYPLESFGSGFLCQEWCFDLSIYLHYTP